jgi:hypothetical protein
MGLIAKYAWAVTKKPTYLSYLAIAFAANVPTTSSSGSVPMRGTPMNQNVVLFFCFFFRVRVASVHRSFFF